MIGVGIITCDRPDMFNVCFESLNDEWYDELVVVDDGINDGPLRRRGADFIRTSGREGVGKAKNKAFKHLLDKGCDYIILVEDDMKFKGNIFEQYINAYKQTGIEHFMFGYHGPANKGMVSGGTPKPRKIIDYNKDLKIALNQDCVGAVCFYTRNCLEKVGLFDENYTNAFEHVDHSYELAKQGFTTPYWWWPDIANSLDYVEEQACSEQSSAIRPLDSWKKNIDTAWDYFERKHGIGPTNIPDTKFDLVSDYFKIRKPKEKISFIVHFRKDTEHRMENLDIVYDYYKTICPDNEFVFVEDDSEQHIKHLIRDEDKYVFYKNDKTYNKCIGYNLGLKEATNNIVCFLDIDCLVSIDSILKCLSLSKKNTVCIGYNGTAIYLQHELKDKVKHNKGTQLYKSIVDNINKEEVYTGYRDKMYAVGNTQAVGGFLIGPKEAFEKINGFNPNFIGWGYEDNEIVSRIMKLEESALAWVTGSFSFNWWLLHLPHEETGVAITDKNKHKYYQLNECEVQKVEAMSKEELTEYIKSW